MRSAAIIAAIVLAASLASGQTNTTPSQGSSSATPGQKTQTGTPSQAPNNGQAAPASGGSRVLQAKSQEELKAYQDVAAKTEPALVEAGADDFAAKYPNSELRASLYIRAMSLYSQSNNTERVIVTGEKAIADDPTNPIPLAQVATALAESVRDTDLDREQRLAEASKDAHAAIDNIDTGLVLPANADPKRIANAKQTLLTMSYDALGKIDLDKKDFPSAEQNLQKAIDLSKTNPDPVSYLRLSIAQDHLQQYAQALDSANKAVQYAKDGSVVQNVAKQQQGRIQKLMAAASPAAGAPTAAPSPAPSATPGQSPAPSSQSTPH
jgi:tetratricopeptide (TPR) repeat protein